MSSNFTVEDIIFACRITTDKTHTSEELRRAEKYLIEFQKSKEAWPFTCEILNRDDLNLGVFAQIAITLKLKMRYDFAQLPQSEYANIAQVLISKFFCHPKIC